MGLFSDGAFLESRTTARWTFNGVKLGARAGRSDPTGRTEALRELCERMPADVRVHRGRAQHVLRWTFPEEHSWRKPAKAERPLSRIQPFLTRIL